MGIVPSRSGYGQAHLDHSSLLTISSHLLSKLTNQSISAWSRQHLILFFEALLQAHLTASLRLASQNDTGCALIGSSASEPTQAYTSYGLTHATHGHLKVDNNETRPLYLQLSNLRCWVDTENTGGDQQSKDHSEQHTWSCGKCELNKPTRTNSYAV